MTKDSLWLAAKILLGLPLLFYALLSVLEPQREIWRKPTKKVLVVFLIAWGAVGISTRLSQRFDFAAFGCFVDRGACALRVPPLIPGGVLRLRVVEPVVSADIAMH
jgi:hypothetical protein